MGSRVVPLQFGDTELLVEVGGTATAAGSELTAKSPGQRLEQAQEAVSDAFERARGAIVVIAARSVEVLAEARAASAAPDELEVKFGLKFSAKGSVVVAEASGEATLEVRLLYRADRQPSAAGPSASAAAVS